MQNMNKLWANTEEGKSTIKMLEDSDGMPAQEAMRVVDEKVAAFSAKRENQMASQDPNAILQAAMKGGLTKEGSKPQTLNAINNMVEDMGIYNEVSSKMEYKKKN